MKHAPAGTLAALACLCLSAAALAGCMSTAPIPQVTAQTEIAANSAGWSFDYPGGPVHSSRGELYLNVSVTLTNHGSVPLAVLAAEFSIYWGSAAVGIPALAVTLSTVPIEGGASATTTVAFLSTEIQTATKIEFRQAGFTDAVSAAVPAPSALPQEVVFTNVTAAWSGNDSANQSATSGDEFLWVNFTLSNRWHASVDLNSFEFKVEDANGSKVTAQARVGPNSVAAGGAASASVIFEVAVGFHPATMLYDDVLGPWTDVPLVVPPLPRPTMAIAAGSWSSGSLDLHFTALQNFSNQAPASLAYVVSSAGGTVYFSGSAGTGANVSGTTTTVNYRDLGGETISMDDSIRISVQPTDSMALVGGLFKVFLNSDLVGVVSLP